MASLDGSSKEGGILSSLRRLDLFPKLEDEFAVQTRTGAVVSLCTAFVVLVLFLSELSAFVSRPVAHHVKVDTSIAEELPIHFKIEFHALRCGECMVDVMDVAGEQQINVDMGVWKQRLNKAGEKLGEEYLDHHKVDPHAQFREVVLPNGMRIMRQVDHPHVVTHHPEDPSKPQVKKYEGDPDDPSRPGEGCILRGSIRANKVAGNFHIALGASHKSGGRHVHHFKMSDAPKFNTTHTIHELSFGSPDHYVVPGVANPLEGTTRVVERLAGHYQYFLQVVSTSYTAVNGTEVHTNQYSVTEQAKMVDFTRAGAGSKIPGVFFVYDVSPFHVSISHTSEPFADFAIGLCAIVGGAVTIAGLVDGALYHGQQVVKRIDATRLARSVRPAATPEADILARGTPTGILAAGGTPGSDAGGAFASPTGPGPVSRPAASGAAPSSSPSPPAAPPGPLPAGSPVARARPAASAPPAAASADKGKGD